jgi:hypothetical protein
MVANRFKAYKIYLQEGRQVPMHYKRAREGADENVRPVIWQRFSYYSKWRGERPRQIFAFKATASVCRVARSCFLSTGWRKFQVYYYYYYYYYYCLLIINYFFLRSRCFSYTPVAFMLEPVFVTTLCLLTLFTHLFT